MLQMIGFCFLFPMSALIVAAVLQVAFNCYTEARENPPHLTTLRALFIFYVTFICFTAFFFPDYAAGYRALITMLP